MNDSSLRHRYNPDTGSAAEKQDTPTTRFDQQDNQHAATADDTAARQEHQDHMAWGEVLDSNPANISPATMRVALKEIFETIIYIVLVFVIVRSLVQNFKIEGNSMEPTLHNGEYILVNKLVYFHFDLNAPLRLFPGNEDLEPRVIYPLTLPERGDVVVFEYPRDVQKDFIKRVIGLPGETVEIRDGRVFIDGQLLDEPYLDNGTYTDCRIQSPCSMGPVVVPPDSIFVMGDNRVNSSDSREWDALPLNRVIGEAWLRYYPLDELGVIPSPSYAADEPTPTVSDPAVP